MKHYDVLISEQGKDGEIAGAGKGAVE